MDVNTLAQKLKQTIKKIIEENKDYITPEMYGAQATRDVDDTRAIQTAIQQAIAEKKPLKLLTQYYCNIELTNPNEASYLHIVGEKAYCGFSAFDNSKPALYIDDTTLTTDNISTYSIQRVTLENLYILGGLTIRHANRINLERCFLHESDVSNNSASLQLQHVMYANVINCQITNNRADSIGIYQGIDCHAIHYSDCFIVQRSGGYAFKADNQVKMSNVWIQCDGGAKIYKTSNSRWNFANVTIDSDATNTVLLQVKATSSIENCYEPIVGNYSLDGYIEIVNQNDDGTLQSVTTFKKDANKLHAGNNQQINTIYTCQIPASTALDEQAVASLPHSIISYTHPATYILTVAENYKTSFGLTGAWILQPKLNSTNEVEYKFLPLLKNGIEQTENATSNYSLISLTDDVKLYCAKNVMGHQNTIVFKSLLASPVNLKISLTKIQNIYDLI